MGSGARASSPPREQPESLGEISAMEGGHESMGGGDLHRFFCAEVPQPTVSGIVMKALVPGHDDRDRREGEREGEHTQGEPVCSGLEHTSRSNDQKIGARCHERTPDQMRGRDDPATLQPLLCQDFIDRIRSLIVGVHTDHVTHPRKRLEIDRISRSHLRVIAPNTANQLLLEQRPTSEAGSFKR